MASKFECPRCGSGIRPGDNQCDRCGEVLRRVERKPEPWYTREAVPSRTTKFEAPAAVAIPIPERKQQDLDQREREIREREAAVKARELQNSELTDSLEQDTSDLEEAMRHFDEEKSIFQEKQEALLQSQARLLELTRNVEKGLNELSSYISKARTQQMDQEDLDNINRLQERFLKGYEAERRKLHLEIERSNIQDLNKVIELEARLRGAEVELKKMRLAVARTEEERVAPPIDLTPDPKVMDQLFKEVDKQIGQGYVKTARGDPIPTHIEKFDTMLGGGIPSGHLVLVSGPPGSMKSTLTYNVLFNAAKHSGLNSMYFSLEQSRESL
ncbi:MAG TPA: ATPase domain-containing protein, partial [Methanomassiliicoccales archaeon]|nr:ATPase domain-containing protein [Methanomassiliicoccales archaeon]